MSQHTEEEEIFETTTAAPVGRTTTPTELETYLVDDEEIVEQPVVDIKESDQPLGFYNRRERRMLVKHLGINRAIKYAQERVRTYEKSDVRKKKRRSLRKRLQSSSSSSSSRSSSSSAPRNTLTTSEEPQMMQATASPSSV